MKYRAYQYSGDLKDIGKAVEKSLEAETGKKLFTLRILDRDDDDLALNIIAIFDDKSVMETKATVIEAAGGFGLRMQGKFI